MAVALLGTTFALVQPANAYYTEHFCNSNGTAASYSPYQDCDGYLRQMLSTYIYSWGISGCGSWAPYNGAGFSTSRDYTCGASEGYYGIVFGSSGQWGVGLNHNQGTSANHLGWTSYLY